MKRINVDQRLRKLAQAETKYAGYKRYANLREWLWVQNRRYGASVPQYGQLLAVLDDAMRVVYEHEVGTDEREQNLLDFSALETLAKRLE